MACNPQVDVERGCQAGGSVDRVAGPFLTSVPTRMRPHLRPPAEVRLAAASNGISGDAIMVSSWDQTSEGRLDLDRSFTTLRGER